MGFIVCCKNSTFICLNILIYLTYNVDSNHQQQYIKNDARQHNYLVILNILIICKKNIMLLTDRQLWKWEINVFLMSFRFVVLWVLLKRVFIRIFVIYWIEFNNCAFRHFLENICTSAQLSCPCDDYLLLNYHYRADV